MMYDVLCFRFTSSFLLKDRRVETKSALARMKEFLTRMKIVLSLTQHPSINETTKKTIK
jgi:hypothetical protein